jgi:siroheme synthase-like protein
VSIYPTFLRLEGRPVVIVGGGPVAASKLGPLLTAGSLVTVVAPRVVPAIRRSGVVVHERPFRPKDLDGAWFVVAAAPPEVNRRVSHAASCRRIFVNAVDDVANATALLGAVLERGGVTVAFSTAGRAPALAGLLREGIDAMLPDDLDSWILHAERMRQDWKRDRTPHNERRRRLLESLARAYLQD